MIDDTQLPELESYSPPKADVYVGMIGLTNSGKTTFVNTVDDTRGTEPRWDIVPVGKHIFQQIAEAPSIIETPKGTTLDEITFYEFRCERISRTGLVVERRPRTYHLCILDVAGGVTTPRAVDPSRAEKVYRDYYSGCHALIIFFPYYHLIHDQEWATDFSNHLKLVRAALVGVNANPKITVFCMSQMDYLPFVQWFEPGLRHKIINSVILSNSRLGDAVVQYTGRWKTRWSFVTAHGFEDDGTNKQSPNLNGEPRNDTNPRKKNPNATPIGVRGLIEDILDECTQSRTPLSIR